MTAEQPEHDREHDQQVTEHARTRPIWTAAEAARRCNVGRATIQRALKAGRIPGAENTAEGWQIPLEGLLAAGFKPDRPAPPDEQPAAVDTPSTPSMTAHSGQGDREHDRAPSEQVTEHDREHDRLATLERELSAERARADLEHAHRVAAEQIAAERAERITDLQTALRMLEPPRPAGTTNTTTMNTTPAEQAPETYSPPATTPSATTTAEPAPLAPDTPAAAPGRPATRRGRFFNWLRGT